ncbi:MAG: hypothetical protein ACK5O1_03945 [Holosporales bacterium]
MPYTQCQKLFLTFARLFLKRSKTKLRNPAQTGKCTLGLNMQGTIVQYKYCSDFEHAGYEVATAIYLPEAKILFGVNNGLIFVTLQPSPDDDWNIIKNIDVPDDLVDSLEKLATLQKNTTEKAGKIFQSLNLN